jgi:hypothetical protein
VLDIETYLPCNKFSDEVSRISLASPQIAGSITDLLRTWGQFAQTLEERLALAREIAARTPPRFIEIPRERGGGKIHYTEEQLTAMRGGLTD